MLKQTLTAAALAAALATPAFAQTSTTAPAPTAPAQSTMPKMSATPAGDTFVQQQQATDWRSSKLVGTSVYGTDNTNIGDINDVLIGSDGTVRAVVVGVGGFLGVGEKNVAIPFNALNVQRKADSASIDKITVSYTKDQLKNAPKFAYYEASGSHQTTGAAPDRSLNTNTAPATGTMKK
jgi:sporulation protein YlmC with PRC-barrel domain